MVDNTENIEKMEQSTRIKLALAQLVLASTDDGELKLDPPFNKSGVDINRVVAKQKHGEPLGHFQAELGGHGQPSYRLALFTSPNFAQSTEDLSFKQKWWDCFPELYQALLEYSRAYVNRPLEEEKKRRK